MKQEDYIVVFKEKTIRRAWHENAWWFSVVDVCGALTDSVDASAYWRKLKQRLIKEGSEVVTHCHGLKLVASDGKKYLTDYANKEGMPLSPGKIICHLLEKINPYCQVKKDCPNE